MPQTLRDTQGRMSQASRRLSSVAVPAYTTAPAHDLVGAPSWLHLLASRLTPQEWRRRLVHMSPGVLAAVLPLLPHTDPMAWYSQVFLVVVILGMALFSMSRSKLFERTECRDWSVSVLGYSLIVLGLLLAFPGAPEIGMAVTMIIAFGDGCATLVGQLMRGPKLPWNRQKSWSGLAAFVVFAIPLATLIYWAEARPGISFSLALQCIAPAVIIAALVESLPMRLNDNIRVGTASGLTIVVMHGMLIGY